MQSLIALHGLLVLLFNSVLSVNGQQLEFQAESVSWSSRPRRETANEAAAEGCWWTGCQPNTWAVVGCSHFNRTEKNRRSCDNGFEYKCCLPDKSTPPAPTKLSDSSSCWWTGCQNKNWAERGCKQHDRVEKDRRDCKDGDEFHCCPREETKRIVDCWWSNCVSANETNPECPEGLEKGGRQVCADDEGYMIECCMERPTIEEQEADRTESLTGESYEDFVKYLFLKSENFTLQPANLRCDVLDPDKKQVIKINDEGVRLCDMCPNFPQKRLLNVFLDRVPSSVSSNVDFVECFAQCFDDPACLLTSYDHVERDCYFFDSSAGDFVEDFGWTTILMTQPTGVVRDWSYTRHTRLLGNLQTSSIQNGFLDCLDSCDMISGCNFASFNLISNNCSLFSKEEDLIYVDMVYGFVSGLRVTYGLTDDSPEQRFVTVGDALSVPPRDKAQGACSKLDNGTHSAFPSKACQLAREAGCDQASGCKRCYYPELSDEPQNLLICPDSEYERLSEIKNSILSKMNDCLKGMHCVGVGYSQSDTSVSLFNMESYVRESFSTSYLLMYPNDHIRKYLQNIEILPKADFLPLSRENYRESRNSTFQQCLDVFSSDIVYTRMSFSYDTKLCKISSDYVTYTENVQGTLIGFKKPTLTSPMINYAKTPGYAINNDPSSTQNCQGHCEEFCAKQCNQNPACFYTVLQNKACHIYTNDNVTLKRDKSSLLLTRLSSLDFTLDSLNKLDAFQAKDIYGCFDDDDGLTQTELTPFNPNVSTSNSLSLRKRRGIINFFKGIAESIVDGFISPVIAAVNTGKGIVNTVRDVLKGDFKKAKNSFLKIPVIKLGKDVGELAGAVVAGDWRTAGKKGLDILESEGFDLVTSVIPSGGKAIGTAGKNIAKAIKRGAKNIVKKSKKRIQRTAKKSKKVKPGNKGRKHSHDHDKSKNKNKNKEVEKERDTKCEKRQKRAPARSKRKRVGKCEDKNNKGKCSRPSIKNVLEVTTKRCDDTRIGHKCDFECEPGYREVEPSIKCTAQNNKRPTWVPDPKCDLKNCGASNEPLIVLETPQVHKYMRGLLGKYITAYVVLFDKTRKLPHWSVALHQSDQYTISIGKNYNAARDVKRSNVFTPYPCPQLSGKQGSDSDYFGSGWHKGHLTPANVARWSEKAKRVSNLYINAAPQDPYTNTVIWQYLESHVACFSKRFRALVATGICDSSIGARAGRLSVPKCFWKMVCYLDEQSKAQVVGFYSGNTKVSTKNEKEQRREQVLSVLSQTELRAQVGNFHNVWLKSAGRLDKGRPVPVGKNDLVWFPVHPFQCAAALDLSQDERLAWKAAFDKGNSLLKRGKQAERGDDSLKKKSKRVKRAKSGIERGCSPSELNPMLTLLGFFLKDRDANNNDNDGDDDGDNSDNKPDEGDGSVLVSVQKCDKRIVGYYTSWGTKGIGGLQLQRLTHVIFAFLEMRSDGTVDVGSPDRKNADNPEEETLKARRRLQGLMDSASRYPHVKVQFAVGGWENSQYFSAMAASPDMRLKFISSVIRMIDQYGFDGVDIDWEYPVTGGANEGVASDKQNYVTLMREIREALDILAEEVDRKEKFLLSFAGAAGQWTLDPGFDLPGLLKYVDFVNVMTYDYFGAWASKWGAYTGPPSPLYFGMPPGFSGKTNADWTIKYYTCKSKAPHKINMGVPFYGRYWKNVGPPVDNKDPMWRKATAINGKFEGGYVPWHEVQRDYLSKATYEKKFHEQAKTPYAFDSGAGIFLGYEDPKSLDFKVKYATEKNVGGLMIWAVDLDDDDVSLLNAVYKAPLCTNTNPSDINHKCSPIDDKRWWTPEDGDDKAGLCGRSAPLYKGFYPVCDPDDPGYSCCGAAGYCGTGPKYCDCPTCKNYRKDPRTILEEPIKPSVPVTWYFLNDADGKRGRCGRKIEKINGVYPTCNPDDANAHCCSNGDYCGNTPEHCTCNGCIDFKKNPHYQFGPKKWWTQEDGADKQGKCGAKAPPVNGMEAECEGSSKFHCCSANGYCGDGPEFCDCSECKDFAGKN